jgi:hypothetical protein
VRANNAGFLRRNDTSWVAGLPPRGEGIYACANLGAWLLEQGKRGPATWRIEQGHATGRINHLGLRLDEHDAVHVAGRVVALMRGTIELD